MTIAYDNALAALQIASDASVEQTKVTQTIVDEVVDKMQAIDTTLTNTLIELDTRLRGTELFAVAGDQSVIELTTVTGFAPVIELNENDRIQFIVNQTNDEAAIVNVSLDGLEDILIRNISHSNQMFAGAQVTLTYMGGDFYVTEQINPQSGNAIRDIGKLIVDSTNTIDIGELAFNGDTLNRADYPILWGKIKATSNLMDQTDKDADSQTYAGFYGDGDGVLTFTLPTLGGEFIRMYDDGRGVDAGREFGSWQAATTISKIKRTNGWGNGAWSDDILSGVRDENLQINTNPINGGNLTLESTASAVIYHYDARPRNIAYYAKTRF